MYDREVFQDVGRAYLISLLDITSTNPISRLLKEGTADGPEQAIEKVRTELKRDSERDSIKKLKLKQKKLIGKRKVKDVEFELVEKQEDNESTAATTNDNEESKDM